MQPTGLFIPLPELPQLHTLVRRARLALGLSQHEVARRAQLDPQTVMRFEMGAEDFRASTYQRILEVINTSGYDDAFGTHASHTPSTHVAGEPG